MRVTIRRAALGDLGPICRLRIQRTAWLSSRGFDQWTVAGRGLPLEIFARSVGHSLDLGETWIAEVDGEQAGTITVNDRADPGLWTSTELHNALIVHFMIVDLRFAGLGIGTRLLSHAAMLTRIRDRSWVRLDAWTTNNELHNYYRRAGFQLARIAGPELHSPSRALFERRVDNWHGPGPLLWQRPIPSLTRSASAW